MLNINYGYANACIPSQLATHAVHVSRKNKKQKTKKKINIKHTPHASCKFCSQVRSSTQWIQNLIFKAKCC